jgi:hypothetical protein
MLADNMKKIWLVLLGYSVGFGGLVLITYRTILALSAPGKMVLVSVNRFGEQYLDVVALVFLWVVCLVGLLCLFSLDRELKRQDHARGGIMIRRVMQPSSAFFDAPGSLNQPFHATEIQGAFVGSFYDPVAGAAPDGSTNYSVSIVICQEDF